MNMHLHKTLTLTLTLTFPLTCMSSFHQARMGLSSSKLTRLLTTLVIMAPILVLRLSVG